MITLADLCGELKNWFVSSRYFGHFTIQDGEINVSDMVTDGSLQVGQWFRIVGSVFNDGVYQYPAYGLQDEMFNGAVWAMAVPPAVTSLLEEMNEWENQYSSVLNSPYTSESFGGYSYTKATGNSNMGGSVTWQDQFRARLNRWRKIRA